MEELSSRNAANIPVDIRSNLETNAASEATVVVATEDCEIGSDQD